MEQNHITVIGGGLAGCEAAWQAARRQVRVTLFEMRPLRSTPAHRTDRLAELVCSNSLGSRLDTRAPGLLKSELERLGSIVLRSAVETSVPAGGALAVGRAAFSQLVTERIESHPLITVVRQEITDLPGDGTTIVATGPLTSDALAACLAALSGREALYFYDAMAPVVSVDSINQERVFRASRYGRGDADYINCPMARQEYDAFVDALVSAERIPLRDFELEDKRFFEACLPVEVLAARGRESLAFGPLRPVGLTDPRTGARPYAVVQLRQDDLAATLYNLVGFQTNLKWGEQKRVFGMIPGLEQAEFVRYGQMHRNTYIDSPTLLDPTMAYRERDGLFFAGQITGTEGYVGSIASGYIAGVNAARRKKAQPQVVFPPTTMIGALAHYVSAPQVGFQPMKANLGLLPPLAQPVRKKRERYQALAQRAVSDLVRYARESHLLMEDR